MSVSKFKLGRNEALQMHASLYRNLFSPDHELPRTAALFWGAGNMLPLGQCSRSKRYVITQGLRAFSLVGQRRNHVPALQLI